MLKVGLYVLIRATKLVLVLQVLKDGHLLDLLLMLSQLFCFIQSHVVPSHHTISLLELLLGGLTFRVDEKLVV